MIGKSGISAFVVRRNGKAFKDLEEASVASVSPWIPGHIGNAVKTYARKASIAVQANEQYGIEVVVPAHTFKGMTHDGGLQFSITIDGHRDEQAYTLHFERFVPYAELEPRNQSTTHVKKYTFMDCVLRAKYTTGTGEEKDELQKATFKFADLFPDPAYKLSEEHETHQHNFVGRITVDVQFGRAKNDLAQLPNYGRTRQNVLPWCVRQENPVTTTFNYNNGIEYYTKLETTGAVDEVPTSGYRFTATQSPRGVLNRYIWYYRDYNWISRSRASEEDQDDASGYSLDWEKNQDSKPPRVPQQPPRQHRFPTSSAPPAMPILKRKRAPRVRKPFREHDTPDSDEEYPELPAILPSIETEDPVQHVTKRMRTVTVSPAPEVAPGLTRSVTPSRFSAPRQLNRSHAPSVASALSGRDSRANTQTFGPLQTIAEESPVHQRAGQNRRSETPTMGITDSDRKDGDFLQMVLDSTDLEVTRIEHEEARAIIEAELEATQNRASEEAAKKRIEAEAKAQKLAIERIRMKVKLDMLRKQKAEADAEERGREDTA
ncbi:uncharacterized protein BDZ99DRAFT_76934 [Mytilinidion resinicola]|uniref:Uncharacterized protein n=1 Tax=Mytilinidion resinicola TaxID=574789 RepID=A0A6A6YGV6_9PEZI|nr:uncharacterized protein BDZ99DRAFT_76934 [Mytilinidion resinicola]KAF2807255.1 hypothetical protein BDZ99DRAFT_76934 [Mytilinidion resinicola]